MKVAVTGGIACGKSLFAAYLREAGIDTLDADDVVREVESPGGEAVDAIISKFGASVLSADGGIDRVALAAMVFGVGREGARSALEAIVHPIVKRKLFDWLSAADAPRPRVAIVPLLFETGWDGDCDFTICLSSARETQIARMTAARGMTRGQAEARIAAQMPVEEKERRSAIVVRNDGSPEDLRLRAFETAQTIKQREEKRQ